MTFIFVEFGFFPHIFNPPLSFQVPCDHVHIMSHLSFVGLFSFRSLHATHSKISSPSAKRCRLTKRKALAMRTCRGVDTDNDKTVVGGSVQHISHRIHVWNINRTHIWLIFLFMVNVDISSIHGSYGSSRNFLRTVNLFTSSSSLNTRVMPPEEHAFFNASCFFYLAHQLSNSIPKITFKHPFCCSGFSRWIPFDVSSHLRQLNVTHQAVTNHHRDVTILQLEGQDGTGWGQ